MSNDNFASANLTDGQLNALVKKIGGEDMARAFLRGEYVLTKIVEAVKSLLTQVDNLIDVPVTTQKFIAAEKLVVNITESAELKISFLGDNLKNWFFGKVEESFAGSQLKIQKLSQNSLDQPILDELGDEEKAETTLYEMFEFLKNAERKWYIFYIKDANERLRAVSVYWNGGGWSLYAYELHNPSEWNADNHVVSRN